MEADLWCGPCQATSDSPRAGI